MMGRILRGLRSRLWTEPPEIEPRFLDQASEMIFAKLSGHEDPGVVAINALTGPLPHDNPAVRRLAAHLQERAKR